MAAQSIILRVDYGLRGMLNGLALDKKIDQNFLDEVDARIKLLVDIICTADDTVFAQLGDKIHEWELRCNEFIWNGSMSNEKKFLMHGKMQHAFASIMRRSSRKRLSVTPLSQKMNFYPQMNSAGFITRLFLSKS